jgi:hypothetical protein
MDATSRDHQTKGTTPVQCAECNSSSGLYWQGWRADRSDEPDAGELPALAFFCPVCANEEFGEGRVR